MRPKASQMVFDHCQDQHS